MTGAMVAAAASIGALLTATTAAVPRPSRGVVPHPPHVMLLVEENRDAQDVLGAADAPYLNSLARRHGVATSSFATSHPSLPNYLELLSGSTWGVADDGTGYAFRGPTLADQLSGRGIAWRAYMEGMPQPCFTGSSSGGGYAKKHDPFMYFTSITRSSQCAEVVPSDRLSADLAGPWPPAFIWVTPNLCHDGHDCATSTMDAWLAAHMPAVLASRWFAEDGIVIITWDEGFSNDGCCGGAHGGHVATTVISSRRDAAAESGAPVDQAGVLRTIEQLYQLPYLGDAACACSGDITVLVGSAQPAPAAPPQVSWIPGPHLR